MSNIDLSIGIITYPPRLEVAKKLQKEIGGNVLLFNDEECKGIRWAHLEAWKMMFNTGSDWLCLLQDDAIIANNFREKLVNRIIEAESKSFRFFQLFNFHEPSDEFWESRWEIFPSSTFMCDLGNVAKFDVLRKLINFYETNYNDPKFNERSCDDIIARFLTANKIKGVATVPNLIDHDIGIKSSKNTPAKIGFTVRASKSFSKDGF